jgi:hypothetical protein
VNVGPLAARSDTFGPSRSAISQPSRSSRGIDPAESVAVARS